MNLAAVHHEPKSRYAYAFDEQTLHVRLRTARGDIEAATLVGGDPFRWLQSPENPDHWYWDKDAAFEQPMRLEYQTELHDHWFVAVQPQWKRIRYAFILQGGGQKTLFGSRGFHDLHAEPELQYELAGFFNFPYLNAADIYHAPAWVKDTVWYQIFPERYADGDPTNNPPGTIAWDSPEHRDIHKFLGGDLQGILDHLDEIQDLGATGIYLTPIFASPTSHKYDTTDYYQIDPSFGTNELFGKLARELHRRGMRLMLDAVFNHAGWHHPFWQDVLQRGRRSPYFECFFVDSEPVVDAELADGRMPPRHGSDLNYRAFGFSPNMPKWNTDHPLARQHLLGAMRYWTETYGVDAWRLDVSNEVSHDFWRAFRQQARSINPEIYILGENWDDAYPWLAGDQMDAVMNYSLTFAIWNLVKGGPGSAVAHYQEAISRLLSNSPKHILPNLYNPVDSHDTGRILHICGGDKRRVRLAYTLLFTFSGAPAIYYGSEVGLDGDGAHNRAGMPWRPAQRDHELRGFVQQLAALRRAHPSFGALEIEWLQVDPAGNTLVFRKQAAGETLYVLLNASDQSQTLSLPAGAAGARDLLRGGTIAQGDTVSLEPWSTALLLQRE